MMSKTFSKKMIEVRGPGLTEDRDEEGRDGEGSS
jgi:hypothetical protein